MGEAADKLNQPERIEQRIEETRSQLDDKLSAIEQRARDAVSVRRRVAERPWTIVGGAAAVGLAVGLVKGWRDREEAAKGWRDREDIERLHRTPFVAD